ncbi:amino acid permease [Acinetobacter baumannii]|jgi:L-asparagine transporter-like permease|uniref:amino acid permease n=1 Tax=Acinetobacter TaxID=469 RepID=UPI000707A80F|nr:amino acid permease [Acinetobacter baumannii]EHU1306734.1 amino acid permease [Acinetobacter baumannii]EHU1429437.1 amino acid permease [Acinetobacter baumannii]EHU2159201.1 amino acid permease [Acinetobacter baumannii]EHU2440568.1 amino acid permease [Acinetobacter baumannii]EIB6850936.1 amino acid permease [Acinetobacter baumannii]
MSSFDEIQNREAGLHKKLSAKQMGMIAIGGAIGTGLFMGSKFAISFAGPAVIVSYAIGGLIAFALMACLAEMTVQHPTSGSFGAYAEHYISPLAGFLVRYCYWACIVLAVGTEITAVADYMKLWFPNVGSWIWIGFFSLTLLVVNAYSVKAFGLVEYWFSTIKVFAIIVFILLSIGILTQSNQGMMQVVTHLSGHGGFFPNGFSGVWIGVIISIFSYLSIEMIAVAAGEAKDPEKAVKKAFKSTALRLILFYLLSLFLIVTLVPWTVLIGADATSPFVMVMKIVGIPYADSILNFIVIVAALSAMNSMLYISTRMLFSLSRAGDAPKVFGRISSNGVPVNALLLSAVGIGIASIVYTVNPASAFPIMIALSMFGALFTWGSIFLTHMFFRRHMVHQNIQLKFKIPASRFISLFGFIAILSITLTTWFTSEFKSTLQFGVPLVLVLIFFYYLKRSTVKLNLNSSEETLK